MPRIDDEAMKLQEQSALTKSQRGRLRKLTKRAQTVQQNSESGICSSNDWQELMELSSKQQEVKTDDAQFLVGPAVHWRCGNPRERVMASDLRDVLGCLVTKSTSPPAGQKRCIDEVDFVTKKLPTWVTLQNPVASQHVGVLELHVESEEIMHIVKDNLLEILNRNKETHQCIHSAARWFDGTHPKSITDALLYASRPKPPKPKRKEKCTLTELYSLLAELVLSNEQRESEGFPKILGRTKEGKQTMADEDDEADRLPDFIATTCTTVTHKQQTTEQGRILGIDCEMVKTKVGSELARVTIVQVKSVYNSDEIETETLWDELVKPCHPVIDYVTEYSGVTATLLKPVTLTMDGVQDYLRHNIGANDIIIGHSIENDLRAVRWIHPLVVDTAMLFRPAHGRHKFSLRNLTAQLLHRQIQNGTSHCSAEDAIAAVELACQRAMQGKEFGVADRTPRNVLQQWSRSGTTVCLGPSDWLNKHVTNRPTSSHALECEKASDTNSKALSAWLTSSSRRARLVYARWTTTEADKSVLDSVASLVAKTDNTNTSFIICLQRGYEAAQKLHELRRARQNPKSTMLWTEDEESSWKSATRACQSGYWMWTSTKTNPMSSES